MCVCVCVLVKRVVERKKKKFSNTHTHTQHTHTNTTAARKSKAFKVLEGLFALCLSHRAVDLMCHVCLQLSHSHLPFPLALPLSFLCSITSSSTVTQGHTRCCREYRAALQSVCYGQVEIKMWVCILSRVTENCSMKGR